MEDCTVDFGALKENVANYIDNELKMLAVDDGRDPGLTPALQRVAQQAALHVQELGGEVITGADIILACSRKLRVLLSRYWSSKE